MGASEFSMNSTAPSLINMLQRVAKLGPEALGQLGGELKVLLHNMLFGLSSSCYDLCTAALPRAAAKNRFVTLWFCAL